MGGVGAAGRRDARNGWPLDGPPQASSGLTRKKALDRQLTATRTSFHSDAALSPQEEIS